jgi:nitroreductase
MNCTVSEALKGRASIRHFLPTPVGEDVVRQILDVARWAPSGSNIQPWKLVAVAGKDRQAVIDATNPDERITMPNEEGAFPVFPNPLPEPYQQRRFDLGEQIYALLDIPREDVTGRMAAIAWNFRFFGAPVALFFIIDRRLMHGQWAHMGIFMQSVALASYERGISTCMQEIWGAVRETLHRHFALGEHEIVTCGMALGYADLEAPVNKLRTSRLSVDEFTTFRGFP